MDARSSVILAILVLGATAFADAGNWPMYRYDLGNSGYSGSYVNVDDIGLLWKYNTLDGQDTDVCVYDGVVYANGWGGVLYALNASTGGQIWNFTHAAVGWGSSSSPAYLNGVVYFGTGNTYENYRYRVFAINATNGNPVCNFSGTSYFSSSPAIGTDGRVYIGSSDKFVYALNASTCEQTSSFNVSQSVLSSPAIHNGTLYITGYGGALYALDASNLSQVLWNYTIGGTILSSPVIHDGILYMLGDQLYAFNISDNHALSWTVNVSSSYSVPTIYGNTLYVGGGDDKKLYAIALNGTLLWNTSALCSSDTCFAVDGSPAVSSNGIVFINVMSFNESETIFYAFNASTGTQLWNYSLDGDSYSEIAIVDGTVYVGTGTGGVYLYAFGSTATTTTTTTTPATTTTTSSTTTPATTTTTTTTTTPLTTTTITVIIHNQTQNFTAGNITTINASTVNATLDITTNSNVTNANITIASYSANPTNKSFSITGLGKYLEINAGSALENALNWILLKIFFTDEEVNTNNLDKSALGIYRYNTTESDWQRLNQSVPWMSTWVFDTGVNETANFVWANVSHFSTYTVGGETASTTQQILMTAGWNLISLPVNLAATTTTSSSTTTVGVAPTLDLTVTRMLMSQGVDMGLYPKQNLGAATVPRIAGRDTIVRAYIEVAGEGNVSNVSAKLYGDLGGTPFSSSPLQATGDSVVNSTSADNWTHSLNFALPQSWTVSGASFYLELDPDNEIPESNESGNRIPSEGTTEFEFQDTSEFNIVIVPLIHDNRTPDEAANQEIIDWVRRMYPNPNVSSQIHASVNYTGAPVQVNGANWADVLDYVTALRGAETTLPYLYYYGVFDMGYSAGVTGLGWSPYSPASPAPVAVGTDNTSIAGLNAVHEIGHNHGRRHAPCGTPAGVDPNYPYANGEIGVVGWRINSTTLYDNTSYADVMSYCDNRWVSDYTYRGFYDWDESVRILESPRIRVFYLSGSIQDGSLINDRAFDLPDHFETPDEGDYRIDLYDSEGKVVASRGFAATPIKQIPGRSGFTVKVDRKDFEVNGYRITGPGGQLLAEKWRTGPPPKIEFMRADIKTRGTAEITWRENSTYELLRVVMVAAAPKYRWEVHSMGESQTTFALRQMQAPTLVRVIISDGVRSDIIQTQHV